MMVLPAQALRPETRAGGMGVFYTWYYAAMAVLPGLAGMARDLAGSPAAPVLFSAAMMVDADAFRAFLELTFMLALPEDLVSRPGFAGHVRNIAAALPPARFPGPTRQELLAMLS